MFLRDLTSLRLLELSDTCVGLVAEDATAPVLAELFVALVEVRLDSFRHLGEGGTVARLNLVEKKIQKYKIFYFNTKSFTLVGDWSLLLSIMMPVLGDSAPPISLLG